MVNPSVDERDAQLNSIIVIGGSAGALDALLKILKALPANLPASTFVVIHTSPDSESLLPEILGRAGVPAVNATDGAPIRTGRVYIAPPDHHLILAPGRMRVTRGPRENRFRPAVDPLFRTAAHVYGSRVIGVILSGGQDDGLHGMALIKKHGGVAIVQDPNDAEVPGMPESVIGQVAVDHVLRADDIAAVLSGLVRRPVEENVMAKGNRGGPDVAEKGADALDSGELSGPPSAFRCPECGGALWEQREGNLLRYQCHVGHGYNGESLVAAQSDGLEAALWTALRALEESSALRQRMAQHARQHGMSAIAEAYQEHARESEERAKTVRRVLVHDVTELAERTRG